MEKRRSDLVAFVSLIAVYVLLVVSFYMLMAVIPRHARWWAQLGSVLPGVTQLYILISDFVRRQFFLLLLASFAFCTCGVASYFVHKKKELLAKLYGSAAVALLLFVLLGSLAVQLPRIQAKRLLMQHMSAEEAQQKLDELQNSVRCSL